MKKENRDRYNGDYQRGGLFMLPFVVIALMGAYLLNAPKEALLSIGGFGLGGASILIVFGHRKNKTR